MCLVYFGWSSDLDVQYDPSVLVYLFGPIGRLIVQERVRVVGRGLFEIG